jgi:beta-galactosidase
LHAAGVENALGERVTPGRRLPEGLEAVRRGPALFLLNHGRDTAELELPATLLDLMTNERIDHAAALAPGTALVLIEGRTT